MLNTGSLALLLCLIALLVLARQVHPGKDQQGKIFNGQLPHANEPEFLEVATFNIQTGKNDQGERDITRAASVVADVHLVGIQEVYGQGWLNKLGFGASQTKVLAAVGDFTHLFAATRFRWFREQRGNTTLSKLPINSWRIEMLPDHSRKSPRNMSVVQFSWKGEDVVFINTHLHTGRGRSEQLEKVLGEFSGYDRVILVGDFNTTATDPILASFLQANPVSDAVEQAQLSIGDEQRIDWILTKGFEVIKGRELPRGVSDHPFYTVSLKLSNTSS